jgi:hypothetical protein
MTIPEVNCSLTAKAQQVEHFDNNLFTWIGEILPDNCDCVFGYVSLVSRNGRLSGSLSIDDRIFRISSLREGISILTEYDPVESNFECLTDSIPTSYLNTPEQTTLLNDVATCEVDVLIFFAGNIPEQLDVIDQAHESFAFTKQVMLNSHVWTHQLKLNLVGVEEIPDFQETNSGIPQNATSDFFDNHNAFVANDHVETRIEETGANIAVLLTGAGFGRGVALIIGGTSSGNGDIPKLTVSINSGRPRFTFAHEIGHAFLGDHQRCEVHPPQCGQNDNERHAHRFSYRRNCILSKKKTYATMVHSGSLAGAIEIANYSNPDVRFHGEVQTGVAQLSDNVQAIKDSRCFLAGNNLRPGDYRGVTILGPNEGCPNENETFSTQIDGVDGSFFSIRWEISSDGFNYTTQIFEDDLTFFGPIPELGLILPAPGATRFIRVTVTTAQFTVVDYHTITSVFDDFLCGQELDNDGSSFIQGIKNSTENFQVSRIYPNPSKSMNATFIDLELPISSNVEIEIIGLKGEIHSSIPRQSYDKGNYNIALPTTELSSGLYLVRIVIDDEIFTEKLTILN